MAGFGAQDNAGALLEERGGEAQSYEEQMLRAGTRDGREGPAGSGGEARSWGAHGDVTWL